MKKNLIPSQTAVDAAREYISRRDRRSNPPGSFDRGGRFFAEEQHECCKSISCPSRAWPYPEMLHARTLRHVAEVFAVPAAEVRRAVKLIER